MTGYAIASKTDVVESVLRLLLLNAVQGCFFRSVRVFSIQTCVDDVLFWMNRNKLKLNTDKTEVMPVGSASRVALVESCLLYTSDAADDC